MARPLFTPEELEAMRLADDEIEEEFRESDASALIPDIMEIDRELDRLASWHSLNGLEQRARALDHRRKQKNRERDNARKRERYWADVEASRAKERARRVADPELIRQYGAAYRERNRKKLAEAQRARYAADPLKHNMRSKAWLAAKIAEDPDYYKKRYDKYKDETTPEQRRKKRQDYYAKKLDTDPDYWKHQYAKNPEAGRERQRRYRAKKKQEARAAKVGGFVPVAITLGKRLAGFSVLAIPPEAIA